MCATCLLKCCVVAGTFGRRSFGSVGGGAVWPLGGRACEWRGPAPSSSMMRRGHVVDCEVPQRTRRPLLLHRRALPSERHERLDAARAPAIAARFSALLAMRGSPAASAYCTPASSFCPAIQGGWGVPRHARGLLSTA